MATTQVMPPAPRVQARRRERALVLATVVSVLLFASLRWLSDRGFDLFGLSEIAAYDLFLRARVRGGGPTDPEIVIVRFDDESLRTLDVPAHRLLPVHDQVLRMVVDHGARVVGFDVLAGQLEEGPESRQLLDTLARNRIVVGSLLPTRQHPGTPTSRASRELVRQQTLESGFVTFETEPDRRGAWNRWSLRRRADLVARRRGRVLPSFPLRLAQARLGLPPDALHHEPGRAVVGDVEVPLVDGGVLIPLTGPGRYLGLSYGDLLGGKLPPRALDATFRDRIVLVASYLSDHRDLIPTPVGLVPGVEVQASILRVLRGRDGIRVAPGSTGYILILVGALLLHGVRRSRGRRAALAAAAGVAGLLFATSWIAFLQGFWIPCLFPCVASLALGVCLWGLGDPVPVAASPEPVASWTGDPTVEAPRAAGDLTFRVAAGAVGPRYEDLELIGRGGMGVVLAGFDRERGEEVALKVLSPMLADRADLASRFFREVRTLQSLEHPSVIRIHDIGPEGALPYYSMELVRGRNLKELLEDGERLSLERLHHVFRQVFEALAHVHDHGIVHRDVKPENIMLLESGAVKLLDFGLAHIPEATTLTQDGQILGTLRYMSPEQREARPLDATSDLFSAALVLYEQIDGTMPFPILSHLLNFGVPYRSLVPERGPAIEPLDRLLRSCLSLEPSDRPASCRAVLARWEEILR